MIKKISFNANEKTTEYLNTIVECCEELYGFKFSTTEAIQHALMVCCIDLKKELMNKANLSDMCD